MMSDLEGLFGIEGWKDDLIEFGIMGGAAVGANIAWRAAQQYIPAAVPDWGRSLLAVALGIAAGTAGSKAFGHRVGTGMAVGLVAAGVTGLAQKFLPSLPLGGLGADYSRSLYGLDDESAQMAQLSGATVSVISPNQQLNGATMSVNEQLSGLGGATTSVESLGYGMSPAEAASLA